MARLTMTVLLVVAVAAIVTGQESNDGQDSQVEGRGYLGLAGYGGLYNRPLFGGYSGYGYGGLGSYYSSYGSYGLGYGGYGGYGGYYGGYGLPLGGSSYTSYTSYNSGFLRNGDKEETAEVAETSPEASPSVPSFSS